MTETVISTISGGWDFIGADTASINDPNFIGDNDPQIKKVGTAGDLGHGVWVAGCASGVSNNGLGIAGVGYNTKLLFTKHAADNQRINAPNVFFGYEGILYAAQTLFQDPNHPHVIINCSWSGSFRSQIAQDLITHVTLDLGCLVVAAAGNQSSSNPAYPASYQHVLSVAATNSLDKPASFTNFGPTIDVSAPGVGIFTTQYNDVYGSVDGTSFSCPITAGAAALVWANNPGFSPLQVGEQLRVTADDLNATNPSLTDRLGKGRINIKNALTQSAPAVRASNAKLLNAQGGAPYLGQDVFLTMDFTNYLKPTSARAYRNGNYHFFHPQFYKKLDPGGRHKPGGHGKKFFEPAKIYHQRSSPGKYNRRNKIDLL